MILQDWLKFHKNSCSFIKFEEISKETLHHFWNDCINLRGFILKNCSNLVKNKNISWNNKIFQDIFYNFMVFSERICKLEIIKVVKLLIGNICVPCVICVYNTLKITYKTSKLCIKRPQDEEFLSIFGEDIVEKVQISNFS